MIKNLRDYLLYSEIYSLIQYQYNEILSRYSNISSALVQQLELQPFNYLVKSSCCGISLTQVQSKAAYNKLIISLTFPKPQHVKGL